MTEPAGAATGPLTVLSAGAAALARSTDLDGALTLIVEAGRGRRGRPIAALFSTDPDRSRLELLVTLGMSDEQGAGFETHGRRGPVAPDPPRGAGPDRDAGAHVDRPRTGRR